MDRLLNRLGRELERAGRDEEALAIYERAESPPSRERRVRVLERLERLDEARALCDAMAEEPLDETERDAARVIGRRLDRKLGLGRGAKRKKRRVVELQVEADPERPIEALVAEHLAAEGRVALRTENWLWRSLFGLAFWDVIFEPLPGVFEHPFQSGPLDLHTADFRRRRESAVARRLDELRASEDLRSRLLPIYEAKNGLATSLVVWHSRLSKRRCSRPWIWCADEELALVADRLSRDLGSLPSGPAGSAGRRDRSRKVGASLRAVGSQGTRRPPSGGAEGLDRLPRRGGDPRAAGEDHLEVRSQSNSQRSCSC